MVVIDVYNQQLSDAFDALRGKLTDMSPVLNAIGQRMETRVRQRFGTMTDPDGHPWAPWKESTVKTYPEDGHRRLLDRYGDMLGSLNHQVDAGNSSVAWGFGQPYATYHEWGTKNMPRRGLLTSDPDAGTLAEADRQEVLDVVHKFLLG